MLLFAVNSDGNLHNMYSSNVKIFSYHYSYLMCNSYHYSYLMCNSYPKIPPFSPQNTYFLSGKITDQQNLKYDEEINIV